MGYSFAAAPCVGCGETITFDPERVPSIRINEKRLPDPKGDRMPLCEACVRQINKAFGKDVITIPSGAYEPADDGAGGA
jgi:hypothetical protein